MMAPALSGSRFLDFLAEHPLPVREEPSALSASAVDALDELNELIAERAHERVSELDGSSSVGSSASFAGWRWPRRRCSVWRSRR